MTLCDRGRGVRGRGSTERYEMPKIIYMYTVIYIIIFIVMYVYLYIFIHVLIVGLNCKPIS